MTGQSVSGLIIYLRNQCSGTRTTGCECPTCVLAVDVQYYQQKRQKRLDAIKNGATA